MCHCECRGDKCRRRDCRLIPLSRRWSISFSFPRGRINGLPSRLLAERRGCRAHSSPESPRQASAPAEAALVLLQGVPEFIGRVRASLHAPLL